MGGYDRDEYEDYDDYEDEGGEQQEEGEEEGGEEEEEEKRKPTAEELQYLELRERIKEQIRKKMQKENGSALAKSQEKKKKLPSDNYGSFFGPSQPVIAQRVIQESKSLLENHHLALNVLNSHHGSKKSSSNAVGSKNGVRMQQPKVQNELQRKVQKLKDTRDYSFLLSDDAELPAPTKNPTPQNLSAPNSEARSAPVPQRSKQLPGNNGRNIHAGREERKPGPMNGQMHSKVGSYKPTSGSRSNSTSVDSRRQFGSNNGIGPGRPAPKGLPSKMSVATLEKKASASGAKNILPAMHKPSSSRMQSSVPKQHVEQRKSLQEPNRSKVVQRPASASSKAQINKPVKQIISSHSSVYDNRPKKKPVRRLSDDEDEQALSMIRRMFNTQRFAGRDDDDSDMEANFDDIMMEERRSAKIARKEDEEQLRLIEEEERREQMRKMAKKRKLSQ